MKVLWHAGILRTSGESQPLAAVEHGVRPSQLQLCCHRQPQQQQHEQGMQQHGSTRECRSDGKAQGTSQCLWSGPELETPGNARDYLSSEAERLLLRYCNFMEVSVSSSMKKDGGFKRGKMNFK